MRTFLLHAAAWAAALQTAGSATRAWADPARLVGVAGILGSVTVFIYRLGVWRQEMDSTKASAVAEIQRFREEMAANFDRIERRLDRLEFTPGQLERMRERRK
jgi:hypothetical protein